MEEKGHEVVKQEGKSSFFWIKLGSVLVIVISWIVLIGLKFSSDISLKIPLVVSIVLTIIGVFAFIGSSLTKKKEEKLDEINLKKPITKEEAKEMLYKIVEERWDHIKMPESEGIPEVTTETIQGNQIYKFKVNLLYKDPIYVIINATYPDTIPTIIPVETTKTPTLSKLVNAKSQNPKEEPDTIEETVVDDLTGRTKNIKRTIQKKKEEDKKEEDLV